MEPSTVLPLSAVPPCKRSRSKKSDRVDGKAFGLPNGWTVAIIARNKEGYSGTVDRYFFEPGTDRQFRSLKAVESYLNIKLNLPTRKILRTNQHTREDSNIDVSKASQKSSKSTMKGSNGCSYFAFNDHPKSVTWVHSSAENKELDPFMAGIHVGEQIKHFWKDTFISISGTKEA